jgi:dTDP-4-dehydrorhamnose 3,5-epimerase
MKFTFTRLEIPEVVLIEHEIFRDARGFFLESYRENDFAEHGIPRFVQDNHSRSTKGVLRGLHYQLEPKAVGKLVRCMRGAIFDVAVDLRRGSPSYGKWVGAELTEENHRMLWVPPGFAHGFCTLSDIADVLYKQTEYYSQEHDRGTRWNDPAIGIRWPIADPQVSAKDASAPLLKDAEHNFTYRPSARS